MLFGVCEWQKTYGARAAVSIACGVAAARKRIPLARTTVFREFVLTYDDDPLERQNSVFFSLTGSLWRRDLLHPQNPYMPCDC